MKYTTEEAFNHYLQSMNLKKEEMPLRQLEETRRAFYGGMSSLFVYTSWLAREPASDEYKSGEMRRIGEALHDFWKNETALNIMRENPFGNGD